MFGAQAGPRIAPPAGPSVVYATSNTLIQASDYAGTLTRDASKLRITRAIDTAPQGDTSVFKAAAPGARFRLGVRCTAVAQMSFTLGYTGLVLRNDVYNPIAAVYVDGAFSSDVTNAAAWTSGNPHPTGSTTVALILGIGDHTVEIVLPYDASVDLTSVSLAASMTLIAPAARTATKICIFGDSIVQGFNTSKVRASWAFALAQARGWQLANLGYGGRRIVASDFTAAGATASDRSLVAVGINDAIDGNSGAYFKGVAKSGIGNYRAAATSAGKPTSRLYVVTPFWSDSGSLVTPLETIRQAWRDAVSEMADPYVTLIEGASGSMPTGTSNFPDHIHPNDAASATISTTLAGLVS